MRMAGAKSSASDWAAAMASSSPWMGLRPSALIAAVSVAEAKKSPTFCCTVPEAPGWAAASSTRARTCAQVRSASSLKPPQRDLSAGISFFAYQPPAANLAKSTRGSTVRSILSMLKPGSASLAGAGVSAACWRLKASRPRPADRMRWGCFIGETVGWEK